MDTFAREMPDIRAEVFRETAARMSILPAIVEKDFWVCWALKRVFSLDNSIPGLIFKGGTSLSKAYGAIRRFSEDIDLSMNRNDLGFAGGRDPAATLSNRARKALLSELQAATVEAIAGPVKEALTTAAISTLGADVDFVVDKNDPHTLLFAYPRSLGGGEQSDYAPPADPETVARSRTGEDIANRLRANG
ncbi:MAG: nucleotidyl transferase AbiEii/AbiGii toxin family protein [Gammaproteobacteria bacterium]|nr:nucleotidyl transferase AbiEii/AbiGii toxin family protein [Gammaproteobacteria bacterium]MYG96685.1 nucleotidyl transferase AbiEii/AbiGii toxin family protein [Gammaproteobacteria bacterium]